MNFTNRPWLAAIGLAGVLAAGALGAGVVMAQEPGDSSPTPTPETAPSDLPPLGDCGPFGHHAAGFVGLAAIVQASGLDREVFGQGFQDGQTVREALEANGLDPDTVVSDALGIIQDRVDRAVQNGTIDSNRADEIMANAEERLNNLLDTTPQPHPGPGPGHHRRGPAFAALGAAADAIGITPQELRDALANGQTVADVAESHGVDVQEVIDAILQPAFDRIDNAVENGRLTADEAETKKAELTDRVTDLVNNGPQWQHDSSDDEALSPIA